MEAKPEVIIKREHKFIVYGRKSFSINGITEVVSTACEFLCVKIGSEMLTVKGKDISIKNLAIEQGFLEADGIVLEAKYSGTREKKPFFKRLFN